MQNFSQRPLSVYSGATYTNHGLTVRVAAAQGFGKQGVEAVAASSAAYGMAGQMLGYRTWIEGEAGVVSGTQIGNGYKTSLKFGFAPEDRTQMDFGLSLSQVGTEAAMPDAQLHFASRPWKNERGLLGGAKIDVTGSTREGGRVLLGFSMPLGLP